MNSPLPPEDEAPLEPPAPPAPPAAAAPAVGIVKPLTRRAVTVMPTPTTIGRAMYTPTKSLAPPVVVVVAAVPSVVLTLKVFVAVLAAFAAYFVVIRPVCVPSTTALRGAAVNTKGPAPGIAPEVLVTHERADATLYELQEAFVLAARAAKVNVTVSVAAALSVKCGEAAL